MLYGGGNSQCLILILSLAPFHLSRSFKTHRINIPPWTVKQIENITFPQPYIAGGNKYTTNIPLQNGILIQDTHRQGEINTSKSEQK